VAQGREAAQDLKPAISAVAVKVQVTEVVESLKRATSVVAEAARMPWVALGMEETNVLPVIEVRRAGALLPAAAGHPAAVEEAPVAVAAAVHRGRWGGSWGGGGVADGDGQNGDKNKRNSDED
jgi:hypothetical protein